MARLKEAQRPCAALQLVRQAEPYLQGDPEVELFKKNFTRTLPIRSDPPGGDFYIRDYIDVAEDAEWTYLGSTPLESAIIPVGHLAYKVTKPGFDTVEGTIGLEDTAAPHPFIQTTLLREGISPAGMIRVPAQQENPFTSHINALFSFIQTLPIRDPRIEEYWLDKYEVTNNKYKEFVDHRAYERKEYWKYPFVKEGQVIPWEEAMAAFRDATGRSGPATWEFGAYPKQEADYPVGGVSWYEAAAYAEFAGKSLPTVHHWVRAAAVTEYPTILEVSNFSGKGATQVGICRGMSPYGSYDMAGNVVWRKRRSLHMVSAAPKGLPIREESKPNRQLVIPIL
jgi:hypothetical protein